MPTDAFLYLAGREGIRRAPLGTATWTNVNGGLGNLNVTVLTAVDDLTLLAGGEGRGVYRTDAGGLSPAP